MLARRKFLTGLAATIAAPAIVRVASLMPVKAMPSVADLDELLKSRMNYAYRIMREHMTNCIYGDRFVYAEGQTVTFSERFPLLEQSTKFGVTL